MPTFQTVRPTSDPVITALTATDPGAAFLELMRSRLVPGAWEFPIDDGLAWIPYRLKHSIQCVGVGDQTICRSTFVLVDNVVDDGQAVSMVGYLNQRSFGEVVWFDTKDRSICVTSSARLDPTSWWNAYLLAMVVPRLVGLCEHLAPRLAESVDRRLNSAIHLIAVIQVRMRPTTAPKSPLDKHRGTPGSRSV